MNAHDNNIAASITNHSMDTYRTKASYTFGIYSSKMEVPIQTVELSYTK